jgi:hypothetical protein
LQAFGDALTSSYIPNLAIVDCTASDVPPSHYLQWMQKGINIITPNKKLGSGPLQQYMAVRKMQRESYIHFFYEVRQCTAAGHTGRSKAGDCSFEVGQAACRPLLMRVLLMVMVPYRRTTLHARTASAAWTIMIMYAERLG